MEYNEGEERLPAPLGRQFGRQAPTPTNAKKIPLWSIGFTATSMKGEKMKKALCIISNILLSIFYLQTSWMVAAAAIFYLVAVDWSVFDPLQIVFVIAIVLVALTPLFCALGILLSVIQWNKGRYLAAFLVQFLPFAIFILAAMVVLLFVYAKNAVEYLMP